MAEKEEKAEESNAAEVTNQFSFFGMTCTTGRRDPDDDRLIAQSEEEDTAMAMSGKAVGGLHLLAEGETMPRKTVKCRECNWV